VSVGQPVWFDVDAFPQRAYGGRVSKIRKNATVTKDTVLFTIEIDVDENHDLLLPFLTANVEFLSDKN
jgi:HlyD family secretion protein